MAETTCGKVTRIDAARGNCEADSVFSCRRGRFEVTTAGFDPNLQLIGGDPWGTPDFTGLVVPTASTASLTRVPPLSQFRYLFLLARYRAGSQTRLVGLRQYASLFATLSSGEVLEKQILSPMWRFPDANISWHVRLVPNGYQSNRNPQNADSVHFRDTLAPALLFNTLGPYTPPNAGRPYGKPVRSDLGNMHDLRYPWRDSQTELELDIPIPLGFDVACYASVAQHDQSVSAPSLTTGQLAVAAPEDGFWAEFSTFTSSVAYGRIAASLIFKEDGET